MKYSDARPAIRSGDLFAFSHGSWRSWREIKTLAVRVFTRSTYSHVGIAWVTAGRVFVLEAVKPCVRIYPLSLSGEFYHLPMGAKWSKSTEEYALENVGYPYSELDAIRAYFGPIESGRLSECAAYAINVYRKDGIDLGNRATPDAVVKAAQVRGAELVFVGNKA